MFIILSDRECVRFLQMFLMHVNDVFIMYICVDFAELNGTDVGDQHQLNIRDSIYMITEVQVYNKCKMQ